MTTIRNKGDSFLQITQTSVKSITDNTIATKKEVTDTKAIVKSDKFKNTELKQGSSTSEIGFLNSEKKSEAKNGIWIWNVNDIPKSDKELDSFLKLASQKGFTRLYVNGHPAITNKTDVEFFKKLKIDFAIDFLTIQSGGELNSVFLEYNLIDRLSLIVAPVLIGGKNTTSLIGGKSLKSVDELVKLKTLKLEKVEVLTDSYIHLNYLLIN